MTVGSLSRLDRLIASLLAERSRPMAAGHCVRIDDVAVGQAEVLATYLRPQIPGIDIQVLSAAPDNDNQISAERAIELRNRKERPLILLVPSGQGHAASSLDNSFQRLPIVQLLTEAADILLAALVATPVGGSVRTLRQTLRQKVPTQNWAEFLATLNEDPTEATLGRQLWQLGLIPDYGKDPQSRLAMNFKAARAISRPTRPVASAGDRLVAGGVRDHPIRTRLQAFLDQQPSLTLARDWTRRLGADFPETLTFELWPLIESVSSALEQVRLAPFTDADGKLDTRCKLRVGGDGQLVCDVPTDGAGQLVVRWETNPARVGSVAKWIIDITPPSDLRTEDSTTIGTARVAGIRRQATIKVEVDEDDLANGTRFVARLTAEDDNGQRVQLVNGDHVDLDSQEFEVVVQIEVPAAQARRSTAASIAEASLIAAIDGLDDLSEDLGSWDLTRGVFSVRIGGRRLAQIRVSPLLVDLQMRAQENPTRALRFRAHSTAGEEIIPGVADEIPIELPKATGDRRARVLRLLAESKPRDTPESADWTAIELKEATTAYLAAYRRALDAAAPDQLADLLLLDTFEVLVKTSYGVVKAVVLLPTHPLRLGWILSHDTLLRRWALQLAGIPKSQRSSLVDKVLIGRITPANLPFTLVTGDRSPVLYFDELTHGSALYLSADTPDPEADAAAVCAAIAVTRQGYGRGVATQLGERVSAYVAAHPGMAALRAIALKPGDGDLVNAGLRQVLRTDQSDSSDAADPLRIELIVHTDRTSYTHPLPALQQLQSELRVATREYPASHLLPPLSLTVRSVDELLDSDQAAHIAIVQGLAGSTLTVTAAPSARANSLEGLLTTTVTTRVESDGGDRQILTMPTLSSRAASPDPDIPGAHKAHQEAVGRTISRDGGYPAILVGVDVPSVARLTTLHSRCDWVLTIDRNLGVGIFEDQLGGAVADSYILDYAPDFVDGIGDRLTVTTTQRSEVEHILGRAMREVGLSGIGRDAGDVLRSLTAVSGRLALRLLVESSLARESVSLAALMMHLQDKGELDGVIVVPVDAHPEIFGPAARPGDARARRCDILLVRVTQRTFKIECVEVKARRHSHLPQALADDIADQVIDTQRLLQARYFANDPARVDAPLQWARLASLLHYYADRSAAHRLIDQDKIGDIHRYIDRIAGQHETPEIALRGFVVSLEGDAGFPKRVRDVPIAVLTAHELGRLGFTTMMDAQFHEQPTTPADQREAGIAVSRMGATSDTRHGEVLAQGELATADVSSRAEPGDVTLAERAPDTTSDVVPVEPTEGPVARPVTSPVTIATPAEVNEHAPPSGGEILVRLGDDANQRTVAWTVSTKGSPHAFILGIPGQGKSVTTRRILNDFADQGLPALVFDFHGDMAAEPPSGSLVIDAAVGLPFSPFELNLARGNPAKHAAWEIAEVLQVVCKLGEIQRNTVYNGLSHAYESCGWGPGRSGDRLPTMDEFAGAVERAEASAGARNARARLTPLTDFGLFPDAISEPFDPTATGGMVVDLSGLGLEQVQLAGGAFLLRKIYNDMFKWPQQQGMRLAVVVDEAHRLARDVTLPRLMKEGRKYGLSVVVASQGVEDFHTQVLENAGTKIVFRTNFPASRKVAGFLRGRGGQDLSEQVERLGIGQAYVSTPDEAQARKVYMRQ